MYDAHGSTTKSFQGNAERCGLWLGGCIVVVNHAIDDYRTVVIFSQIFLSFSNKKMGLFFFILFILVYYWHRWKDEFLSDSTMPLTKHFEKYFEKYACFLKPQKRGQYFLRDFFNLFTRIISVPTPNSFIYSKSF